MQQFNKTFTSRAIQYTEMGLTTAEVAVIEEAMEEIVSGTGATYMPDPNSDLELVKRLFTQEEKDDILDLHAEFKEIRKENSIDDLMNVYRLYVNGTDRPLNLYLYRPEEDESQLYYMFYTQA